MDNKITNKDILTLLVGKNTTTCPAAEEQIQKFNENPESARPNYAHNTSQCSDSIRENIKTGAQNLNIAENLIDIRFKEDVMQFFQISSKHHPQRAVCMEKLKLFFDEIYPLAHTAPAHAVAETALDGSESMHYSCEENRFNPGSSTQPTVPDPGSENLNLNQSGSTGADSKFSRKFGPTAAGSSDGKHLDVRYNYDDEDDT